MRHFLAVFAALLLALQVLPAPVAAHEIPARVTVQTWVRTEPGRLIVLVRVPLEAMRDVAFPLRGDVYLDTRSAGAAARYAAELWLADALAPHAGSRPLGRGAVRAVRIALPGDASFASYPAALAAMQAPPPPVDLPWQQALLDTHLEFTLHDPDADITLKPSLAHLGLQTTTIVRYTPRDGEMRVYQFNGDPEEVRLDPRWHHAALQFVKLGFMHILGGIDHLLFLLCLVLPLRRIGALLVVVTSFTVAHSLTLIAAALGAAPSGFWFPPVIEAMIALSIVWMAFENIVGARTQGRWLMAFAFGLVHGFGFSFLLRDSLQLAGRHMVTSLLAFNVGVELGQVVVLALLVPALALLFRKVPERAAVLLLSALVAHSAWHWLTERAGQLRQVSFSLPELDVQFALALSRAVLLMLLSVAALWALRTAATRVSRRAARTSAPLATHATPAARTPSAL